MMSVELTLLARVGWRGVEITGFRLRGLLALLAGDLRTGCGSARLGDPVGPQGRPQPPAPPGRLVVARRPPRAPGQGVADAGFPGPAAAGVRGHREHADRLSSRAR